MTTPDDPQTPKLVYFIHRFDDFLVVCETKLTDINKLIVLPDDNFIN